MSSILQGTPLVRLRHPHYERRVFFSRTSADATLRRYSGAVAAVRARTKSLREREIAALCEEAVALRKERRAREVDAGFPIRAIALAAEGIRRAHGFTPYDCQLVAGLALADGCLAEMATGEGKTLVALLPAFVFGLAGRGAHVCTVNPYLAARDCEFARAALEPLGITVALNEERTPASKKRAAYAADVTYGVGTEFGFDYLRDQLAIQAAGGGEPPAFHEVLLGTARPGPQLVQRGHAFAVVDEADSILIDEARSPLIISTGSPRPCDAPAPYLLADRLAREFRKGEHFIEKSGSFELTAAAHEIATSALTDEALGAIRRVWPQYLANALHATHRMRRDVNYIVAEGKVVIVDEFTGRPCPERTWREGLHQAVEAAAGVEIQEENSSEATITRPAYFRLYGRVAGMTGTAAEAEDELRSSYGLDVRVIPLNRPSRREQLPDRIFITRAAKITAVAKEIATRRERGQPVLIGTRTIANSEELAAALTPLGIPFRLLNAKQDKDEAEIIEQAGEPKTVTIATNMAGRGAHIPLPPESERVGGLHVIGLERHESARIDRQLTGRAARQGQPGSAQFFLSIEDEILTRHAPKLAAKLARLPCPTGELSNAAASHFLRAQRAAEAADRHARRELAQFDKWLDDLKHAL